MADINLIPKEYIERKKGAKALFSKINIIIFGLIILSLLFYGGLLLYQRNLDKNLEIINEEIINLETKRDISTEEAMVELDKKITTLKTLFEEHLYWSDLLEKIEELVIPEAYFFDASVDILEGIVTFGVSGGTTSYTNLARQILSFQESPYVNKVQVFNISLDEKLGIKFGLKVNFSNKILLGEDND